MCGQFEMAVPYGVVSSKWQSAIVWSVQDGGVLLCGQFYMAVYYWAVRSRWRSVILQSVQDGGL